MILLAFTSFLHSNPPQHEEDSSLLVYSIKTGNLPQVKLLINGANINGIIPNEQCTPLVIAILSDKPEIVKFLLANGADPNYRCKGRTPLMHACKVLSKKQIKLLLDYKAKINETDSSGTTSLMIAAAIQPSSVGKLLIRRGASLNVRNKAGYTARDFSVHTNNKSMSGYLRSVFEHHLPNYTDGPYVTYLTKKKLSISYLTHDSLHQRSIKHTTDLEWKTLKDKPFDFNGKGLPVNIFQKYSPEPSTYNQVEKLYIIGDIHGQCDTLKKFLLGNGIINKAGHWNFGNGHVLFIGDIYDRGEQVTEALWLIYRLEQEAKNAGGMVHLLLGNHEIMTFTGDTRYVSEKYQFLFKNLNLDYQKYNSNKSVLVNWLKSKNTIIRIDSILFVHGGIHPDLINYHVSIDSINHLMHSFLNAKHKRDKPNSPLMEFLLSVNGPFWYRGMVQRDMIFSNLNDNNLESILKTYQVNKIMVGHTYLKSITQFYNSKVYGIDVPFYLIPGSPMEAVYKDRTGIYRSLSDGSKTLMDIEK